MELNYTPLSYTPLNIDQFLAFHAKSKKTKSFDGIFLSLSFLTIITLLTIIYSLIEKKFITGL